MPIMSRLYPRIIPVHNLPQAVGIPDPITGRLTLAYFTPASYVYLEADGAYVLGMCLEASMHTAFDCYSFDIA